MRVIVLFFSDPGVVILNVGCDRVRGRRKGQRAAQRYVIPRNARDRCFVERGLSRPIVTVMVGPPALYPVTKATGQSGRNFEGPLTKTTNFTLLDVKLRETSNNRPKPESPVVCF